MLDTKPHYTLLDGLRGVAVLMVVWYHIFEGFAFAGAVNGVGDGSITIFNHGYLAVDFFFMLSGFVISYSYDDRWGRLSAWQFFKRRLIRLHPMLVVGVILGLIAYCLGGCCDWNGHVAGWTHVLTAFVLALFLIPMRSGAISDVRGNGEMFPLNGPSWSLFFEYIGNILYALIIRRLSTKALSWLVGVLGIAFVGFAVGNMSGCGSIGVGWTLDSVNFCGGLLRMLFPFTLGMLLQRTCRPAQLCGAFGVCALLLFAVFSVPFLGANDHCSLNGLYETACIIFIFPLIVLVAAGSSTTGKALCFVRFLGDISYPLYIVHYPVMYLFYAWLIKHDLYSLSDTWCMVMGILAINILLAYLCVKFYDVPIRRWFTKRFGK